MSEETHDMKVDDLLRRLTVAADGIEKCDLGNSRSLRRGYEELLREAALALRAAADRSEGVSIKALEWEQGEAQCPFGLYSVHNPTPLMWSVRLNRTVVPGGGRLPTEHAAQSFAQAHFDAAVRSCLSPPQTEEGAGK